MRDPLPLFHTKLDIPVHIAAHEHKDIVRWNSPGESSNWRLELCPCGLFFVSASPVDGIHTGFLTEEEAKRLMEMDRFTIRWHQRGYDELSAELDLPYDKYVFGFYPPEYIKKNKPHVHTYFLYEKVKP